MVANTINPMLNLKQVVDNICSNLTDHELAALYIAVVHYVDARSLSIFDKVQELFDDVGIMKDAVKQHFYLIVHKRVPDISGPVGF